MFFIAGTKGETSTAGSGEFYCPQCENYTRYLHRQVHQKATVFFVPVANLKLLGEYVECQSCDGTDRRNFSYTFHIPERMSGKDLAGEVFSKRTKKLDSSRFWSGMIVFCVFQNKFLL